MPLSTRPSTRPGPPSAALLPVIALSLLAGGCTVFGKSSVEEAPYTLVSQDEEFEIRDYDPVVVAETRVDASFEEAGSTAFRRLFDYISGENEASDEIAMTAPVVAETGDDDAGEEIAMTAPVTSERDGESWRYAFVLPSGYTIDTAPRPLNPDISLRETAPKRVAVVRYSGRSTEKARTENERALIEWVDSQDLEAESAPRWAGYDAPWTLPPFRRNEVLVDVAAR